MKASPDAPHAVVGRAARALLVVAVSLVWFAPPCRAQLAEEPQPEQAELTMGVVAKVNGQALTGADLNYFALGNPMGMTLTPEFYRTLRKMLAERLLLADEAERLGLKLNEFRIDEYYETFFGRRPPYAEIDEVGLSVERQKELVRTLIYAELYVLHRVGIATDHMHLIPADPLLTRMMDVTPKQLKDYFRAHPEQFKQPEAVEFTVWPCEGVEAALGVLNALEAGGEPLDVRGLRSRRALRDLEAELGFVPDAVELLTSGEPGDLGGPFRVPTEAGTQALVMRVDAYLPEVMLGFTGEVQEALRRRIQATQLELARAEALDRLRRDARSVYWPDDLFDVEEPQQAPAAEGLQPPN